MAKVKIGGIHARKDRAGMYEATYYVNGQRRRALAETREAASFKVAELMVEAEKESDVVPLGWDRDIALSPYAANWLDNVVMECIEPRTVEQYRQILNAHVIPFRLEGHKLGDMKLRDIRQRHIKTLLISKRKHGYAKDTVRHIRAALSSLLTDAVEDEIIEINPALQVSNRKRKIADRKNRAEFEASITPMSAQQFAAFSSKAQDPKEHEFGPFFIFLGKTGLRPSEAIALLPSDINEKKREVRVNKVFLLNSGRIRPYTKTGVERKVDLSLELCELLKQHKAYLQRDLARRREEAFQEGKPSPKTPEMLFPNRAGKYIDWNNAADAFHRICGKAKIGKFRPYALRHTFATILLSELTPLPYVSKQLGHSNPTTTLRYYAKWIPDQGRSFVDVLDNAGKNDTSETIKEAV
jgi:integrase